MKSLEEAFEPFGSLNRRMGKANAQAAARALAESVLEEAERSYARNYFGAHENDSVAISFRHLRARIEKLGHTERLGRC